MRRIGSTPGAPVGSIYSEQSIRHDFIPLRQKSAILLIRARYAAISTQSGDFRRRVLVPEMALRPASYPHGREPNTPIFDLDGVPLMIAGDV